MPDTHVVLPKGQWVADAVFWLGVTVFVALLLMTGTCGNRDYVGDYIDAKAACR